VSESPHSPPPNPDPPENRYRRAWSATLPTIKFLPTILFLFSLLGAALGWWFGIGIFRGLLQGIAFGIFAMIAGATFTFIRFAAQPELLGPRRSK
jgi:hypothetical protein